MQGSTNLIVAKQTQTPTASQPGRQAGRQAGRQTDRHKSRWVMHIYTQLYSNQHEVLHRSTMSTTNWVLITYTSLYSHISASESEARNPCAREVPCIPHWNALKLGKLRPGGVHGAVDRNCGLGGSVQLLDVEGLPISSKVVPFCGLYLGYYGAYG